jgi:glucan phosphoethanolaminetransferase (alkaline phosphatase superfamily)
MPDLTTAQAWITILLGVLLPLLIKAIKWCFKQEPEGKLAFAITILATVSLSTAAHYLAKFFASPPAWFGADFAEIFLLSQIVYQLLKEKFNL